MNELTERIEEEIIEKLDDTYIDCPDCEWMYSDEQYTCTTCWCEGGHGKLHVLTYIKENPEFLNKVKK